MSETQRRRLNEQILDEATDWFIELRAGTPDASQRGAFDEWCRRSPEHIRAYIEIAAIWSEGADLDPTGRLDLDTLIARARASADDENVVALKSPMDSRPRSSRGQTPRANEDERAGGRRRPRSGWRLAAAACVLGALAGAATWYFQRGTYTTDIGEQRSIALADGSTVELNSRSHIHVDYTSGERIVELLQGQALFHVAKDATRPFLVRSAGTTVRAVGTEFDVYRRGAGVTTVTVLEGTVAVLPAPDEKGKNRILPHSSAGEGQGGGSREGHSAEASILLSATQQITITASGSATSISKANLAAATAWTQRHLVFEAATLQEVAGEFNRYNTRQLAVEGPGLDFHVDAVFTTTDLTALLEFLAQRPEVVILDRGDSIEIRHR